MDYEQKIEQLRKEIDTIDEKIISLLEKRMGISKKTAAIKKEHKKDIFDRKREQEIIRSISSISKDKSSLAYIKKIYGVIMDTSREIQKSIIDE